MSDIVVSYRTENISILGKIYLAKAVPLFSGSKGNSYYIGTASEGVLIDAGRSCKQIENAMITNDLNLRKIGAVFITHEHDDHCHALRVLASRYQFRVYASRGTLEALRRADKLDPRFEALVIEDEISVGNMLVKRINTPHDAAESCCYSVTTSDGKVATIATDMGYMTDNVKNAALHSDFAVIESNHDIEMLKSGPYPFVLKRRILSDRGHMSNEACAKSLVDLVKGGTLRLMLGHLSEQNNTPNLAMSTAVNMLAQAGARLGSDYTLDVAPCETNAKAIIY